MLKPSVFKLFKILGCLLRKRSTFCEPSKSRMKWDRVLIDLSGTIHDDQDPIPGAIQALQRLRDAGLRVKFVTNTTKESKSALLHKLVAMGFMVGSDEVQTSLTAASDVVRKLGVRPLLLLEDGAMQDFKGIDTADPNAVVVGLAPSRLDYPHLDQAMSLLLKGCPLIAIHKGRYYKADGALHIGPGPFVVGLEYAAHVESMVVGKPESGFFQAALDGDAVEKSIMIGDDAHDDVQGAVKAGMAGVLVQTGKYRKGDESSINPAPTHLCVDFPAAVELILSS